MKSKALLFIISILIIPKISQAAYRDCEDATNSGRNLSVLLTGWIYDQLECDTYWKPIYENILARMGANPLDSSDSEYLKICYFEGRYNGLMERVPVRYGECLAGGGDPDYFACIPVETVAMFAANVVIGAALSIDVLTPNNLQKVLTAEPEYPICEETEVGSCSAKIDSVLAGNPDFNEEVNVDEIRVLLIERLCIDDNG